MELKYALKVFIIAFLIFSLILFMRFIELNSKDMSNEGFAAPDTSIIINKSDAFCETYKGSSGKLEQSCKKLTNGNCNSTSCCVWTSDNKCAAGGKGGPTFNTDLKGKTNALDYYYFQDVCYGGKCPEAN